MSTEQNNTLSPLGFTFELDRLPHLGETVQTINLPGVSVNPSIIPSPIKNIPIPGDHIEFEELSVTFLVNENLNNYIEMFKWIKLIAPDISLDQREGFYRKILSGNMEPPFPVSDGSLIISNAQHAPVMDVRFKDMFPTALSSLQFNVSETDVIPVTCTITFQYVAFELEGIE